MHAWAFIAHLVISQSIFIYSTPTATYSTKTIVTQTQTVLVSNLNNLTYVQRPTDATIVHATSTLPTPPHPLESYRYDVPATPITLVLWSGFRIDPAALKDTIYLAQRFIIDSIGQGAKGPLPTEYDPFESGGGFGAVISLTSVTPVRRLTWEDLNDTMQGLWDFLVRLRHSFEVKYEVWHKSRDIVLIGRGRVEAA